MAESEVLPKFESAPAGARALGARDGGCAPIQLMECGMIFEAVATGGCRSYVVGCEETCAAALVDPELSQIDRYIALAARHGLRIRYLIDTHTHADHFSATQQLARQLDVPVVMHCSSPAPFVDLRLQGGELLI